MNDFTYTSSCSLDTPEPPGAFTKINRAIATHNTLARVTDGVRKVIRAYAIPDVDGGRMTYVFLTDYGLQNAVSGLLGLHRSSVDGRRRRSPLCTRALRVLEAVWHVLHVHIHSRGIVHGDVRSANVSLPHPDHEGLHGYPDAMLGGFLKMKTIDDRSTGGVAEDVRGMGRLMRELVTLTPEGVVDERLWRIVRDAPKLSPLVDGSDEDEAHVVTTLICLADRCVHPEATERPDMQCIRDVLGMCTSFLSPGTRRVSDCGSDNRASRPRSPPAQQSHSTIRDQ